MAEPLQIWEEMAINAADARRETLRYMRQPNDCRPYNDLEAMAVRAQLKEPLPGCPECSGMGYVTKMDAGFVPYRDYCPCWKKNENNHF